MAENSKVQWTDHTFIPCVGRTAEQRTAIAWLFTSPHGDSELLRSGHDWYSDVLRGLGWTGIALQPVAEVERLRAGLECIQHAIEAGRVCEDVAWVSAGKALFDFIAVLLGKLAPQDA